MFDTDRIEEIVVRIRREGVSVSTNVYGDTPTFITEPLATAASKELRKVADWLDSKSSQ